MHSLTLKGIEVQIYASPNDLPIKKFKEHQKYALIESGLGSTIEDYAKNASKTVSFIINDKLPDAVQMIKNSIDSYNNTLEKVNVKHYSFACLVYSIGGKEFKEVDTATLDKIITQLSDLGLTEEMLNQELEEVKKN